ncbi:hypothetical protein SAMN06295945_1977 [Polynucleobacter meluiroseus]|uniref:Glucosyl transferase GtrII n=1 Tax=Polynucleobacter meluiroseus TaxID=1938814 RepID=A0A240E310_9BURK|nr:hypothetical protein [Polynucleobacter meluiroseus]SNX29597.1 hypothetical protein SAMN06295945_1977 [Polynucleobacter meluiroseus]
MIQDSNKMYYLCYLYVFLLLFFVIFNIDSMWNWSGDLAHHYALAYRISEQWSKNTLGDPSLGDMTFYPNGSHIIVAIIGNLIHSVFLALQIATLTSYGLVWLFIIILFANLPKNMATSALVALSVLVIINSLTKNFDTHGHEIVANFFFSQLVGQSVLYGSIIFAIKIEKWGGIFYSTAALIIMMLINAKIHLLPSIEMLGLIFGLLITHIVFERSQTMQAHLTKRKIIFAVIIMTASVFALLIHPSFLAMAKLSTNDGSMLSAASYPFGILTFCFLVTISSLKLFRLWLKMHKQKYEVPVLKYLALYGGVLTILCLTQYILTFFGLGSDYAVKKYIFGLTSILFIQISIIFGSFIIHSSNLSILKISSKLVNYFPLILISAFLITLFFNVPYVKSMSISNIVLYERKIVNLSDTLLPLPENNKYNVVVGLNDLPNTINYMLSIAITKTPMELAISDVLAKNDLNNLSNYSYVITSKGNKKYNLFNCESISNGSILIIPAKCLER